MSYPTFGVCDGCHRIEGPAPTRSAMASQLSRKGWHKGGLPGEIFCPACEAKAIRSREAREAKEQKKRARKRNV